MRAIQFTRARTTRADQVRCMFLHVYISIGFTIKIHLLKCWLATLGNGTSEGVSLWWSKSKLHNFSDTCKLTQLHFCTRDRNRSTGKRRAFCVPRNWAGLPESSREARSWRKCDQVPSHLWPQRLQPRSTRMHSMWGSTYALNKTNRIIIVK